MTKTVLVPGVAWPYELKPKTKPRSEKTARRFANSVSTRLLEYIKEHPGTTIHDAVEAFPDIPRKTIRNQLNRMYRARRLDHNLVLINGTYCCSYRVGERA